MDISTVNHDARKERHHKLFGKVRSGFSRFRQIRGRMERYAESARRRFSDPLHGHSPAERILHRVTALGVVLMVINSVNLSSASYDSGGNYDPYSDLAIDTSVNFVSDEEGYLTKVVPWDGEAQYLNRGDEFVTHEVSPGDTLSVIAYRYGVSMNTLLWANPALGSGNLLKVGQELRVPPSDGYEIIIASGDSLDKLYEKYYDGDEEKLEELKTRTLAINSLAADGTLTDGQKLFIVGGEKPYEYVATVRENTYGGGDTNTTRTVPTATATIEAGEGWMQPTTGVITQWFHPGHYAIDIAGGSDMDPVFASLGGTVTRAESDGGYHGGYGNVITIDHGATTLGNCQTLYAHNSTVYVSVGDSVATGQQISDQGNTGRVYGRTGIHLHIEVICDGTKVNPSFLFGY